MPIELVWETEERINGLEHLFESALDACLAAEGLGGAAICVRIVDDAAIRAINRETRGLDSATDVLSFPTIGYPAGTSARDNPKRVRREYDPAFGCPYLGDCVLSLERARAQAAEYGHSLQRELGYLLVHSALHLLGYDHMEDSQKAQMRGMEERIMRALALSRGERDGGGSMTDQQLFDLACEAMHGAYVPYSNFQVGACLLAADGRTFAGCNIENASYGATICAERAAVSVAVCQGARKFTAIAVVGSGGQAWPCGICRQVLNEFSDDMRVICGEYGKGFEVVKLSELLPRSFGPSNLNIEV